MSTGAPHEDGWIVDMSDLDHESLETTVDYFFNYYSMPRFSLERIRISNVAYESSYCYHFVSIYRKR